MTIEAGRLPVSSPAPARANRWPIDSFFTSLAADQNHHAVCIVLSGAGSDGSRSLREVKQHGGLILAQAQDDGQAHGRHAAQRDGHRPGGPPAGRCRRCRRSCSPTRRSLPRRHQTPDSADGIAPRTRRGFAEDLRPAARPHSAMISATTSGRRCCAASTAACRPSTSRRCRAARPLRREPHEIDLLFHELLVGVTQFFRDPPPSRRWRTTVLPAILAGKGAADPVRIWVPGCASGEEVYSLAILLKEAMDRRGCRPSRRSSAPTSTRRPSRQRGRRATGKRCSACVPDGAARQMVRRGRRIPAWHATSARCACSRCTA